MTASHDRFEALAGAVLLGEASDGERAELAEHAATCEACALDLADRPLTARVAAVAESEQWRPDISAALTRRIRTRRESRLKVVIGSLGGALAACIAIQIALSGMGTRMASAIAPPPVVGAASDAAAANFIAPVAAVRAERAKPAFAAAAAPVMSLAAKRHAAKIRAAQLAALREERLRLSDPVDSRESARKLIPTGGILARDPLEGTPLDPVMTAHAGASRHVAVDPRAPKL